MTASDSTLKNLTWILRGHRPADPGGRKKPNFGLSRLGSLSRLSKASGLLALLLLVAGCSDSKEKRPDFDGGIGAAGSGNSVGPEKCEDGESRSCSVTIDQANGKLTCYHGVQHCDDDGWGNCTDGSVQEQVDPTSSQFRADALGANGSFKALALGDVSDCGAANPCDPSCQIFNEDPPGDGITVATGGGPGFETGTGGMPDSENPPGDADCDQELCTEGGSLEASCHPCVADVCAAQPSCCTTAWDDTCVDLVFTTCAEIKAPPEPIVISTDPSICEYGIFSEGDVDLTSANDWGVAGGSIAANGNISIGNGNLSSGLVFKKLVATGTISLGDRQKVGTALAGKTITKGSQTTIGTEMASLENLVPAEPIIASVVPEKTFGCTTSGGTNHGDKSAQLVDYLGDGDSVKVFNGGGRLEIGPGSYNKVIVDGAELVFTAPGEYYFDQLLFPGNGHKIIVPNTGTVIINVCSDLQVQNGSAGTVKANGDALAGSDALRLQWYTNQTGFMKVGPGALIAGVFMAPKAEVQISSGNSPIPTYNALVYAKKITATGSQTQFDVTGMTDEACKAAGVDPNYCGGVLLWSSSGSYLESDNDRVRVAENLYDCIDNSGLCDTRQPGVTAGWESAWSKVGNCTDGVAVPACPVDLALPATPPVLDDCYSGQDCQMNHRCTEVLTDGSCGHSKCEEGSGLAADCDSCVERICAIDSACCSDSWDSDCVEMVETVCDAKCAEPSDADSGTCVANGDDYRVEPAICSDIDLAVDFPCENKIPICNHGNEELPAGEAELRFYPDAAQQFATETPDPYWMVGTCAITSAIPPGECINQDCDAALLDEPLTVEVQLIDTATVTECSVLDNWSYYADSRTCQSAAPEPYVQPEVYIAECPAGTTPSWGLLSWSADTPGDTTVVFDIRAADEESNLSDESFVNIATAQRDPDTQVCDGFDKDDPCVVDITALLWGSKSVNQPVLVDGSNETSSALEVRLTLTATVDDSPTLTDWGISYSCLFDE